MPGNAEDKKIAVSIKVMSKDPSKDDEEDGKKGTNSSSSGRASPPPAGKVDKFVDTEKEGERELSEEDQKLKDLLQELTEAVIGTGVSADENMRAVQLNALNQLTKEIRASTSSMTSVPKPLKFMRPHYEPLKEYYATLPDSDKADATDNKTVLADIISVLAMTIASEGSGECLDFRLRGVPGSMVSWGHEYVRYLSGELGTAWNKRTEAEESTDDLNVLLEEILPFKIKHNAEYEAVDLLVEIEALERLPDIINADNLTRIAKYLLAVSDYLGDSEDQEKVLEVITNAYLKHERFPDACRVAIKRNRNDVLVDIFQNKLSGDEVMQKQCAYVLAAQRLVLEEFEDEDDLFEVMGNANLAADFQRLAVELDVKEAKTPEDIYKSHLQEGHARRRPTAAPVAPAHDSAKKNLASTFVNAFINCAFGNDTLVTPEGADWVYKNRDHGMLSAAASHGLIALWDVETGFSALDKYSQSQQDNIKAGGLLGTGLLSCGVSGDMDAAFTLLGDHLDTEDSANTSVAQRKAAVLGLGLAYAGTAREDVLEMLVMLVVDDSQPMEVVALTCLSLGLIFCGTASEDISGSIIEAFLDRSEADLRDPMVKLMCLGIGLLYLQAGDAIEGVLAAISVIKAPIVEFLKMTVRCCAFVGSGSVLEVQRLLSVLTETAEEEKADDAAAAAAAAEEEKDMTDEQKEAAADAKEEAAQLKTLHQEVAVLGIAMIAMGESLASTMAFRSLDHVLQYCDVHMRRAVPLALGLLSISKPALTVMDTLSKLSHDQDERVSQNAIMALGFIGSGTNNSRIAGILRELAAYYGKEPNHLFLVRIAQGLLHLGKGLMTLDPFHSDGFLLNRVSMAGILTVIFAQFDAKNTILADKHYLLYSLVTAIRPRMLVTVDEEGNAVPVSVRVGQKVDTVGQAGNPRTITGFQTHTTPVLVGSDDRVELGSDEYIPLSTVLEGYVIVKKNPNATGDEQ